MDGCGWLRCLATGLVVCLLGGCSEDTAAPESADGAGMRVVLPPGTEAWESLTIELVHENLVLPPTCPGSAPFPLGTLAVSAPEEDLCTRKSVEIWNLLGERVRYIPDIPFPREGWDTRDDQGELVPSGIYRTHEECLDSQGVLVFDGHYYVSQVEQEGSCAWVVWSDSYDPGRMGRTISIESFPIRSQAYTVFLDADDRPVTVVVTFDNPYRVIVRGPSGEEFKQEINLVEGEFTEVYAVFPSASTINEE